MLNFKHTLKNVLLKTEHTSNTSTEKDLLASSMRKVNSPTRTSEKLTLTDPELIQSKSTVLALLTKNKLKLSSTVLLKVCNIVDCLFLVLNNPFLRLYNQTVSMLSTVLLPVLKH
jgi:hypothetical protein